MNKNLYLAMALSATLWFGALAAEVTAADISNPSEGALTPARVSALRTKAKAMLGTLPAAMPGSEKDTQEMVDLGRKLYFDTVLSVNRTISCNSCHVVNDRKGGVDAQATSPGAFGKRGGRNSPTVLNAGFQFAQFWDGRAATLEEQAKGPILNPVEMAMPNEGAVLERLKADSQYEAMFKQAFPGASNSLTYDNLAKAIAAFERTLVTRDRFDDFLSGSDIALSSAELAGLNLFLTAGCTTCHNRPTIGGRSYQKLGLVNAYENAEDQGRFGVTKDESDKMKFKVPVLRNIALTGPYFHDGKLTTLEAVVPQMAWLQLGRKLTEAETGSLVAFLRSLTDKPREVKTTAAN